MFTHAIVCPPGESFAKGISSSNLGAPDLEKALLQHKSYCQVLEECGLKLTTLAADPAFPDSTFVEDTAIVTERCAVITRPGAPSRQGEVARLRESLSHFYTTIFSIQPPGTLEGGDILRLEDHFYIGISARTNPDGADQLAGFLRQAGYSASLIDIRGMGGILHLKSGVAYIGDRRLVAWQSLAALDAFQGLETIKVEPNESYAANCLKINDCVLLPAGFPNILRNLQGLGYPVITLEMSEFQKMDGGLSCLSLRF